jgi:hypothetical protein
MSTAEQEAALRRQQLQHFRDLYRLQQQEIAALRAALEQAIAQLSAVRQALGFGPARMSVGSPTSRYHELIELIRDLEGKIVEARRTRRRRTSRRA